MRKRRKWQRFLYHQNPASWRPNLSSSQPWPWPPPSAPELPSCHRHARLILSPNPAALSPPRPLPKTPMEQSKVLPFFILFFLFLFCCILCTVINWLRYFAVAKFELAYIKPALCFAFPTIYYVCFFVYKVQKPIVCCKDPNPILEFAQRALRDHSFILCFKVKSSYRVWILSSLPLALDHPMYVPYPCHACNTTCLECEVRVSLVYNDFHESKK